MYGCTSYEYTDVLVAREMEKDYFGPYLITKIFRYGPFFGSNRSQRESKCGLKQEFFHLFSWLFMYTNSWGYFVTPKIGQLFYFCWLSATPETHFYVKNGHFWAILGPENGQNMVKPYFLAHWPNPQPDAPTISRDEIIWMKNKKMAAKNASSSLNQTPPYVYHQHQLYSLFG